MYQYVRTKVQIIMSNVIFSSSNILAFKYISIIYRKLNIFQLWTLRALRRPRLVLRKTQTTTFFAILQKNIPNVPGDTFYSEYVNASAAEADSTAGP